MIDNWPAPRISLRRRLWQRVQEAVTAGHWPARLAHALGGQAPVSLTRERIAPLTGSPVRPALRIGFASDFHAGPCTHPRVLDSATEALARLEPEVLLLGGDFVCLSWRDIRELAPRLAELPARFGKFAVLGNHDYYAGAAPVVTALERAGIRVLFNEAVRLAPPFDSVWICGLDDPIAGHPDAMAATAGAVGERIVLMHSPSGLQFLGELGFLAALAGHTHGGQLALPGGKPLFVPEPLEYRRYVAGSFNLSGGRRLLVTRGVGYSTVPLRTNCPSEIMELELEPVAGPGRRRLRRGGAAEPLGDSLALETAYDAS